jgi:hypothetical protein
LTSNFHVEYLHVERYTTRGEVRKMSRFLVPDAIDRSELRARELHLRRAAERARTIGPLRRAVRRGRPDRAA